MIKSIIDELTKEEISLVNPLLKAKVFATRLKNERFLFWINKELTGYEIEDEIPKYRIVKANSTCNIQQGNSILENTPIPISLIKDKRIQESFYTFSLFESVKVLEEYKNVKSDYLTKIFPVDFWAFITNEVKANGYNAQITNISVFAHKSSVYETLIQIRNKFLDLLLEIELNFPDLKDDFKDNSQVDNINERVTQIMNTYNITNYGNQNQIAVGNYNNQEFINSSEKELVDNLIVEIAKLLSSEQIENETKQDIQTELSRIENQLSKDKPQKKIIKQSLSFIGSLVSNIIGNALTQPTLNSINQILSSF